MKLRYRLTILFIVSFFLLMTGSVYAQTDELSKLENPLKQTLTEGAILNIGRGALTTGLGSL